MLYGSTLTEENQADLERVQKNAFQNILKEKYISYKQSLLTLKMDTLYKRREKLLKTFGSKCLNKEQTKHFFPFTNKIHTMTTRLNEKFEVLHANTERLKKSTVPYIQRMLNLK